MDIREKIVDLIRDRGTQVPTLPIMVQKILDIAQDDNTSAKSLGEVVHKDQAITNKILKLSNSAYFGLATKVDSIPRAIALIGFNEVVGMAIGMNVFSQFESDNKGLPLDMRQLWIHAIGSATAARLIAQTVAPADENLIFLAGLMHDIGKVIFTIYFPDEYGPVIKNAQEHQVPLFKKEKELLGLDHTVLAKALMQKWNFPETIWAPIRYHHSSGRCPDHNRRDALIIELADFICHASFVGNSGCTSVQMNENLLIELNLSVDQSYDFIAAVKLQQPEIEAFFNAAI
jgi:putative nucleotidyltransferase with HDIG domain